MAGVYATVGDLATYGLPAAALAGVSAPQQQAAVDAANALADSYLASRYRLPITGWGKDLVRNVAVLAAYECLVIRGFNPSTKSDMVIKDRADAAVKWFEQVGEGKVHPTLISNTTAVDPQPGGLVAHATVDPATGAFVVSESPPTPRGW